MGKSQHKKIPWKNMSICLLQKPTSTIKDLRNSEKEETSNNEFKRQ
jgi:hypothetical protein